MPVSVKALVILVCLVVKPSDHAKPDVIHPEGFRV